MSETNQEASSVPHYDAAAFAPVVIRVARLSDGPALAALDRDTWSTLHAVMPRPEPGVPFFDERHRPDHYLVPEIAGRPAGYVCLVPPTPLAANAHVRQIQGLVVAPWARGRGVARALMEAARGEAARQGAVRITLRVLGHNTAARRLYESLGYVAEGVLPGEFMLDGKPVDDVLMGRPV
jgi:ribosomal protein S18 acetylase RimI-like enzyme